MTKLTWTELHPAPWSAYSTTSRNGPITVHAEAWNWELSWDRPGDGRSWPLRITCPDEQSARDLASHIDHLADPLSVSVRSLRQVARILHRLRYLDEEHAA